MRFVASVVLVFFLAILCNSQSESLAKSPTLLAENSAKLSSSDETTISLSQHAESLAEINRGKLLFKSAKLEAAELAFQRAAAIEPISFSAFYNLGFTYVEMKNYDKALPALRKAVALSPNTADAWHLLGFTYDKLGVHELAIECYLKA